MKKSVILSNLLLSISILATSLDYSKQEEWEFITGKRQSPINIETLKTVKAKTISDITIDFEKTV